MVHSLRAMLKSRGPSFAERIKYPSNLKLQSPKELLLSVRWILCNLIDRFDDPAMNKCEWYDFIWVTFRALRRKVTQFQLNDLDAVYMLEICTRFHIFSVHGMCEMVEHGFVEHLNYENLSKCLITLNQLYNDLNLREIYCANEAEFRSYHALFFHKSDLQRNVFKLDPIIRRTPELQFALKCILALNSNNYIEFFNLVREADYLTACLLYRQFLYVRYHAFMRINKSHKPYDYHKVDLIKQLGFEDENDIDRFCDYMGVECEPMYVNFDLKNNLITNRRRPMNLLCKSLIEFKRRNVPLSEIIAGGKFVFDKSELDYLGPERNEYSFNADDDVVYEDDLIPIRRLAESIVAEQMWKSIFFCVVGERIVDAYERLNPPPDSHEDNSEVSIKEDKAQQVADDDEGSDPDLYLDEFNPNSFWDNLERQEESARILAANAVHCPVEGARPRGRLPGSVKPQFFPVVSQDPPSDPPKETRINWDTFAAELLESWRVINEGSAGAASENVVEESAEEAIEETNDSASEATEQATASENVNESASEVVEAESSSSFENADLNTPGSPTTDNTEASNADFEARALATIMNSVLRVVRKRGAKR